MSICGDRVRPERQCLCVECDEHAVKDSLFCALHQHTWGCPNCDFVGRSREMAIHSIEHWIRIDEYLSAN